MNQQIPKIVSNTIICGDCLELMETMENNTVDITITSPPYNIGGDNNDMYFPWRRKYGVINDNMSKDDYFQWVDDIIEESHRVTKHHVFFNIQEVQGNRGIIKHILEAHDPILKDTFIWVKPNGPPNINKTVIARSYEYIFCFSKDHPEKVTFSVCNFNLDRGEVVRNILILPIGNEFQGCFAFPNELPEYFIRWFCPDNGVVFDPFSGSGTTCYMAKKMGKQYLGMDLSPEKVELAKTRLEKIPNYDLFHYAEVGV